jgi:transposase
LLDRGSFHKTKRLKIPSNILLLFLPAYSPELNPVERLLEFIKAEIANKIYVKLEPLIDRVASVICSLSQTVIQSLTSYLYFINAINEIFQ